MNKIFISYSHDSPEHADLVLALTDRLIRDGADCIFDQYEESAAEGWTRWMDRQIRAAEFVLMIFTETYGKRVDGEEEPGKGFGVKWMMCIGTAFAEPMNIIYEINSVSLVQICLHSLLFLRIHGRNLLLGASQAQFFEHECWSCS